MDRNFYESLKIKDPKTGVRPCDNVNAKDHASFVSDSIDLTYEFGKYARENLTLSDAIDWILGFDMFSEDAKGGYTGKYSAIPRIGRGRIITYDAFGHIGTEQKKNRPAIVLKENQGGVIIAPIGKRAYKSNKSYHVSLKKGEKSQGNMTYNCGIKLEQIRYIDKGRITGLYGKVSSIDKLNEIDDKLLNYLAPLLHKAYTQLQTEVTDLQNTVQQKEQEILDWQRKYHIVKQELEQYKFPVTKDGA